LNALAIRHANAINIVFAHFAKLSGHLLK